MVTILNSSSRPVEHLGGDHLDQPVRGYMTPGVVTLVEDASLRQAFGAMVAHHVHAVLVVGRERGLPLGWVTARGLLPYLESEDDMVYVRDAVSEEPRAIEPSATIREAVVALSQPGTSHLLVTPRTGVAPEGVLSDLDLMAVARR
jgi:CBS domain-containing protein